MTPSAIEEIFNQHPSVPLRLTLSSGDQIAIRDSSAAVIAITHIYLFPNLRGRFSPDFGKYVSLVNVAMIEPLPEAEYRESQN